jgi:hypothetical protein
MKVHTVRIVTRHTYINIYIYIYIYIYVYIYVPNSCKYTQSGLLQGMPLMKLLQYFVVPKDALNK